MIRWSPKIPAPRPQRWQSRAEFLNSHREGQFAAELRSLTQAHYALCREWEAIKREYYARKAGFNPNQPRVPAGNSDGGQWTLIGGGGASRVRLADASNVLGSGVMSDANPDPIIPGAQYAQTQIVIYPSALTGMSTIDETTTKLTNIAAKLADIGEFAPGLSPQAYGTAYHVAFATTVRLAGLPGIGFRDVETTFGGDRYGSEGSIRTDVVLRNDVGDIIAIYDVKTGDSGISPRRRAELRSKTGVGPSVPIIEINLRRGVMRKAICSRLLIRGMIF